MNTSILIVDNSKLNSSIKAYLLKCRYNITTVKNSFEALIRLKQDVFDIMLTNIHLPNTDTIDFIHKVKKIASNMNILVIGTKKDSSLIHKAMNEGVHNYIYEPFELYQLKEMISHNINRVKEAEESLHFNNMLALSHVSNSVTTETDLNQVLNTIVTMAVSHTHAQKGVIAIADSDKNDFMEIKQSAGQNLSFSEKEELEDKINDLMESTIYPKEIPILISHSSVKKLHPLEKEITLKKIKTSNSARKLEEHIIIPLTMREHLLGVLEVDKHLNTGHFTKANIDYLSILANQAAIAIENNLLMDGMKKSYINTIQSLALMIEAKSPYTKGHLEGVSHIAMQLGRKLKLSNAELTTLIKGASLHDIGKIGIYDRILDKPSSLTEQEYQTIKQHPVIGYNLIEPITFLNDIKDIVKHHHERMDGTGYPDKLHGSQIPLMVKIVSLADAYEAMISDRPYRKGLKMSHVVKEIEKNTGTQFDSELVTIFLKMIYENKNHIFSD